MTISYSIDLPAQYINLSTYLSEQNPVTVPIGSDNSVLLGNLATSLTTKYGSSISLNVDSTDTTPNDFDYNYLFPRKKGQATLKGGIYFLDSVVEGANTVYPFYSLCITRSPTSYFFLPTLASQTIINKQFSKNI